MSREIQKFCVSFVACAVASHGLKIVIMSWNCHITPGINYFPKLFLVVTTQVFLVKFRYWFKFHVSIITSSGVMTIFVYKRLTRNRQYPRLSFAQYLETGLS